MCHSSWNLIPDCQTYSWKVIRTLFAFLALILIFQMFCFLVLIFGLICCSKATLQKYTFMVFPPFFQLVSSLPIYLLIFLRVSEARFPPPWNVCCGYWLLRMLICVVIKLPPACPLCHLGPISPQILMHPPQLGYNYWGGSTCLGGTTGEGTAGKMSVGGWWTG